MVVSNRCGVVQAESAFARFILLEIYDFEPVEVFQLHKPKAELFDLLRSVVYAQQPVARIVAVDWSD